MRTWDYNGFAVGPILNLLEYIFDPKIWDFFMKMIFFGQVGGGGQMAADLMNQTITNIVFGGIIRIFPRWRAVQYVSSNILKLNFQFESAEIILWLFRL